jgi:hypothetical protein
MAEVCSQRLQPFRLPSVYGRGQNHHRRAVVRDLAAGRESLTWSSRSVTALVIYFCCDVTTSFLVCSACCPSQRFGVVFYADLSNSIFNFGLSALGFLSLEMT